MNLEEFWRNKSNEDVRTAAADLSSYTFKAQQIIHAEMQRRDIPEQSSTISEQSSTISEQSSTISEQSLTINEEGLNQLITIAAFSQPIEAHLVKTRLESEGIECFLANEHIVTMNWLWSNAVGGVELQVKESDVEKATEILALESVSVDSARDRSEKGGELHQRVHKKDGKKRPISVTVIAWFLIIGNGLLLFFSPLIFIWLPVVRSAPINILLPVVADVIGLVSGIAILKGLPKTLDQPKPVATSKTFIKPQLKAVNCNGLLESDYLPCLIVAQVVACFP